MQEKPVNGHTGLEGLAGTPQRVASPANTTPQQPTNNLDDLMGVFSNGSDAAATSNPAFSSMSDSDILGGFGGMNFEENSQLPPPQSQMNAASGSKKTNEDLLSLF